MREIKFRGQYIDTKEFVCGFLTYNKETGKSWIGSFAFGNYYFIEVYTETVSQYTGLKDKNGKEIYEGDIVGGYPHGTVLVRWCEEYACFEAYWEEQEFDEAGECGSIERTSLFANELNNCNDVWVILGNIYENPELI